MTAIYLQSATRFTAVRQWLGRVAILLVLTQFVNPQPARGQTSQPALTTVKDTVYRPDGTLATGSVVITWDSFMSQESKPIFGGSKTVMLINGALLAALTPNVGATPAGTSYTVRYYQSGAVFAEEFWVVPTSTPVPPPNTPAVTVMGLTGTATYCYWVSAVLSQGETNLSPAGCTSTGRTTLSSSNFNRISWAPVAGSTSYRVFRASSSTPPVGTGAFLVATTSLTTTDDISSTLQSSTIPEVNTTDTRTLQQVRVAVPPPTSLLFSPTQITGTAIVSNPLSTQTITSPATTGVGLRLRGHTSNPGDILQVFQNQNSATPTLSVATTGGLVTSVAPTVSNLQEGSVLFSSNGGQLSQSNNDFFWDAAAHQLRVGPRTGMSALAQNALGFYRNSFSSLNPPSGYSASLGAVSQSGSSSSYNVGTYSLAESAHPSGNRDGSIGIEADAIHSGAGTITDLMGLYGFANNSAPAGGNATRVSGMASVATHSGAATTTDLAGLTLFSNARFAGSVVNNYGLKIDDQSAGTNNWAIKTGAGTVEFGGPVVAAQVNGVSFANQFSGADPCAKITSAIANLPGAGGIVDARGFTGTHSCAAGVADGGKSVVLLLGSVNISTAAATLFTLTGQGSAILGAGSSFPEPNKGTTFFHTGSGAAIQLGNSVGGVEGVRLKDFNIVGSSNGSHGVKAWSMNSLFENIIVSGYTGVSSYGLELITSDTAPNHLSYNNTCLSCEIRGNTYLVKLTSSPGNGGANNNRFIGGRFLGPFTIGFILDNAQYTSLQGAELSNSTTAGAIGLDVRGTSAHTSWVGGLIEFISGAGSIGVKTAAGTTGTRLIGTVVTANATDISDGSTSRFTNMFWEPTLPISFQHQLDINGTVVGTREPCVRFNYAGDNLTELCFIGGGNFRFRAGGGGIGPIHLLPENSSSNLGSTGSRWGTGFLTSLNADTSVISPIFASTSPDPADAGTVRLGNNESIAAEASPAGADGTIKYNSANQWEFSSPLAFDGATADTQKTVIAITDPTAARTFTLPNADSNPVQPATCSGTDKVSAIAASGIITCSPDQAGSGSGGDNLRVEDGDNAGTFTAMSDADFDDSGDIDFQRTAGAPDSIAAVVRPNSVALTTDTTGNYVGSVADGAGIDGTASGEGAAYTPTLDLTELNSHTFGDNTSATLVQTFDPSGATNPAWSYSSGAANLSTGTLQQGGTAVALQSVTLSAGNGLTGGGDISANRGFDVAVTTPIEISGDTVACSTCTTAGNTQTFTNKTLDTEGTGNVLLLPQKVEFHASGCDGSTAAAAFDLPTSNAPAKSCQGTSPHRFGTLEFADGASALTSSVRYLLPGDWTSTGGVDIRFIWSSGSTSTNSAVWTLQTACAGDGEDTANPTYNTTQTVSDSNNATANTRNSASLSGITVTGCAAGETLFMKVGRDPANGSDTLAATALLHSIEITVRRQI